MMNRGVISLQLVVKGGIDLQVIPGNGGTQNPYFIAWVSSAPKAKHHSKPHNAGYGTPIWNENVKFEVDAAFAAKCNLHFDVKSAIPSDAAIGACHILVSDIMKTPENTTTAMSVPLNTGGNLLLDCTWSNKQLLGASAGGGTGRKVDDILNDITTFESHNCSVYLFGDSGVGVSTVRNLLREALLQFCRTLPTEQVNRAVQAIIDKKVKYFENKPLTNSDSNDVVLYIYDVCSQSSLEGAVAKAEAKGSKRRVANSSVTNVDTFLIGNKMDMEYWRQVPVFKGEEAAKTLKVKFCEISALTGQHIDLLLDVLLRRVFPVVFQEPTIRYLLSAVQAERVQRKEVVSNLNMFSNSAVGLGEGGAGEHQWDSETDLVGGGIALGGLKNLSLGRDKMRKKKGRTKVDMLGLDLELQSPTPAPIPAPLVIPSIVMPPGGPSGGRGGGRIPPPRDQILSSRPRPPQARQQQQQQQQLFDDYAGGTGPPLPVAGMPQQVEDRLMDLAPAAAITSTPPTPQPQQPLPAAAMAPMNDLMAPAVSSNVIAFIPSQPTAGAPVPPPPLPPIPVPMPMRLPSQPMPQPSLSSSLSSSSRAKITLRVEDKEKMMFGGALKEEEEESSDNFAAAFEDDISAAEEEMPREEGAGAAASSDMDSYSESDQSSDYNERNAADEEEDLDDAVNENVSYVSEGSEEDWSEEPEPEELEVTPPKEEARKEKKKIKRSTSAENIAAAQARDTQLARNQNIRVIEPSLDRGEHISEFLELAHPLSSQSIEFQKASRELKRAEAHQQTKRMCLMLFCCPCLTCATASTFCYECCTQSCLPGAKTLALRLIAGTKEFWTDLRGLFTKKGLMDNVLADNENAFQTLAKLLAYLIDLHLDDDEASVLKSAASKVYYYVIGVWVDLLNWVCSYAVVLTSTVVLILPSFFTLLIVRTTTIEKEAKAFGARQEAIRTEKKEESAIRWVRIILRSLPMSFFLLALPYLLVFRVFPSASNDAITLYLVLFFVAVIVLQLLGSVRSYYSWKSKDVKPPKAPTMYYQEEIPPSLLSKLNFLSSSSKSYSKSGVASGRKQLLNGERKSDHNQDDGERTDIDTDIDTDTDATKMDKKKYITKKSAIPWAANRFDYTQTANIIELASLSLEFFQMATFSMQNNPYSASGEAPTSMPTMAPSATAIGDGTGGASSEGKFWGTTLFETVYVNFPVGADLTYLTMWGSVGLVALLLLIFSTQFLFELRRYGCLMRNMANKDKARDSFFFSFTGAIVYGHGNPNNISDNMRLLVATISDGLFLIISLQLLQVFACDYSNGSIHSVATLRTDPSIVCWEGRHATLAFAALISYAFYVPLSVMITPMLLEAPRPETDGGTQDLGGGVTYAKLYLMSINVVKSVMLLVGVLGPQGVLPVVIASTIASYVLGNLTYFWFRSSAKSLQDTNSKKLHVTGSGTGSTTVTDTTTGPNYFSTMQPCNVAFINYWKAASYTAAVVTAIVVAVAHELDSDVFPLSMLTPVLAATWGIIIVSYATAYFLYSRQTSERARLLDDLISYPFYWRDLKEKMCESGEALCAGAGATAGADKDASKQLSVVVKNESPSGTSECLWIVHPGAGKGKRNIPGFKVSPWHDSLRATTSYGASMNQSSSRSQLNPVLVSDLTTGEQPDSLTVVTYDADKTSFSAKLIQRNLLCDE